MKTCTKVICAKGDVRIPACHPRLFLVYANCNELKHTKFQFLSKPEAREIFNNASLQWSCYTQFFQ